MNLAPHPFTLRQLQYLVAVAEAKSFRKAAEACRVSQPALSAQVAQCEDLLGVQLFERDRRHVALTSAGEVLIARMRQLLVGADDLVEEARGLGDPFAGTLRVGVIPTIGPYLLPEVAPALRKHFPRLELRWVEDKTPTLSRLLATNQLDAAILALEAELGDVAHAVLGKDAFVFAAAPGHPLAASRRPIKVSDLDGEQVLLLDDGHCFRDQALAACASAGAAETSYRATSLATLVQMAAQGHAVTLLPSLALGVENRRRDLVVRRFSPKPPARTIALVWRRRSAREAALEVVAKVLAAAYPKVSPAGEETPAEGAERR